MNLIGSPEPATDEAPSPDVDAMPELVTLERSVQSYRAASQADNTRLAYGKQWDVFAAWCVSKALSDLPATPESVALYLAACADAGLAVATLAQAKSAISQRHEEAAHTSPCAAPIVKEAWAGIRRRLGVAQNQKQPLDADQLRAMYAELPEGLLGVRDRALIGLGFSGAFRRSELVALDVTDLSFVRRGLEARVRRSKTDQEGHGLTKNIARSGDPTTCTVRAVRDWLELAGIAEGPVFRSVDRHGNVRSTRLTGRSVALILKRAAQRPGSRNARFLAIRCALGLSRKRRSTEQTTLRSWTRPATRVWPWFSGITGVRRSGKSQRARNSVCRPNRHDGVRQAAHR